MGIELFLVAVIILMFFALFDLIVGVSNDAVNFLNSSLGSKVAPRFVIMIIASTGIIMGVAFSGGMMEVARKGIFHPEFFTMPEMMMIFLSVMLTDIILLDLFNTYGLPTSTTVSIVFELLGGAVIVSILKIVKESKNISSLAEYINTSSAMLIIFGILLSVIVAFISGTIVQFLSRLIFTFDYKSRLRRYGGVWGGIALASITYFILVKGAKGASFISEEQASWIKSNALTMLGMIFVVSFVLLQILLIFKINVLKPIVLIGTFALAMAFAANDLVNFIGVPMAGFHAYNAARESTSYLTETMGILGEKVKTENYMLLIAGLVMVITLWFSKKSKTVSQTELSLGNQGESEGEEKYESIFLSRVIVRMFVGVFGFFKVIVPKSITNWLSDRFDTTKYTSEIDSKRRASFDLLRASVNLMVASAVISFATSYKLPLSTTYVTFMVSMGSSFADRAWGRESAVYRVTGVFAVVGGWFMTAFIAFSVAGLMALTIFYLKAYGVVILLIIVLLIIFRNKLKHKERSHKTDMDEVFILKKISDVDGSVSITFKQIGLLIKEIKDSLDKSLEALYKQNSYVLRDEKKKSKVIQKWSNVITANIFKTLRLMNKEHIEMSIEYTQSIRRLQKLVDGHHDIVIRSYDHISNQHKGLLDSQIVELKIIHNLLIEILTDVENAFVDKDMNLHSEIKSKHKNLKMIIKKQNDLQVERIKTEESKTRLSILFYSILGNTMMLSKQTLKLMEIFSVTLNGTNEDSEFDMD
ncbi:MAG: inorganic phosphate transporter [Clostridiales bacterium]